MNRIIDALNNANGHRFELHLQPIAPIDDIKPPYSGGELLLRLIDDHGIAHNAGHFLPLLAEYPDIQVEVDWWVLREARRLADLHPDKWFSINLSPVILEDKFLPGQLGKLFAGCNSRNRIFFEISERTKIRLICVAVLSELSDMFPLWLDDMGEARLSLLDALPVSGIKIDGALISHAQSNQKALAIVRSLMKLASELNYLCIAEFVSCEKTYEMLVRSHQKTPDLKMLVQGFYISEPLSLA